MTDLSSIISMLDGAVDAVCAVDLNENIVAVNANAQSLWGFATKELVGTWFGSLIAPDDNRVAFRALKEAVHGKPVQPFEARVVCKDGSMRTMHWTLKWSAENHQTLCLARDVTEQRASEFRLRLSEARSRLIIESLPIGLAITDAFGMIELANPALERMFGRALPEMIGCNIKDVLASSTAGARSDRDFIGKIAAARAIEQMAVRPDGSSFPVEVSVIEFAGLSGPNYAVTLQDVTDRHEIEKLKKELVSLISHDVGGPLTSVQGIFSLLEEDVFGELDDEGHEAVTMAAAETARLINLIDGLVGVTKSTFGSNRIEPEPAFLSAVLAESIEKLIGVADGRRIGFITPELNPRLHIDKKRLTEVLSTFLTLAIQTSIDGGIVEVSVLELDQRRVTIRVFPARPAPKTPTSEKKTKDDSIAERRSILGLAICKSIIEHHGGTLEVCDEVNARFSFTLPLAVKVGHSDVPR